MQCETRASDTSNNKINKKQNCNPTKVDITSLRPSFSFNHLKKRANLS